MLDNLQAAEEPVAEPEVKDREGGEHQIANQPGKLPVNVDVLHGGIQQLDEKTRNQCQYQDETHQTDPCPDKGVLAEKGATQHEERHHIDVCQDCFEKIEATFIEHHIEAEDDIVVAQQQLDTHTQQRGHEEGDGDKQGDDDEYVGQTGPVFLGVAGGQHQYGGALLLGAGIAKNATGIIGGEEADDGGAEGHGNHYTLWTWLLEHVHHTNVKQLYQQEGNHKGEGVGEERLLLSNDIPLQCLKETVVIEVFHFTSPFVTALNNSSRFTMVSASSALRRAMTMLPCSDGSA